MDVCSNFEEISLEVFLSHRVRMNGMRSHSEGPELKTWCSRRGGISLTVRPWSLNKQLCRWFEEEQCQIKEVAKQNRNSPSSVTLNSHVAPETPVQVISYLPVILLKSAQLMSGVKNNILLILTQCNSHNHFVFARICSAALLGPKSQTSNVSSEVLSGSLTVMCWKSNSISNTTRSLVKQRSKSKSSP